MNVLLTPKYILWRNKMDRTSIGSLGIGLVVGAAIGVALGILYAPKSGVELRSQIKEKASEIVEKAKDKASEIKHTVACKIDKNGENC
jgi:gas vesicle protein